MINQRLKNNNFDLLRLIFAAIVVFVHAYEISGFKELSWVAQSFSSTLAVRGFFIVSGFLIFMSYERSSSLRLFFKKRFLRIYPAYLFVVVTCAVGLSLISSKNAGDYFSLSWLRYVISNLAFLNFIQQTLPGVFETNPIAAVNGALWTLKVEVMFYFSVPFFVFLFRRYSKVYILFSVYCLSLIYVAVLNELSRQDPGTLLLKELARQLPGQLSYFMAGAFLFYYQNLFERNIKYFLAAAIFVLIVDHFYSLYVLAPLALSIVVIFLALYFSVGNFTKYGDFSYGIYILHFPLIQLFIYFKLFRESAYGSLFLGALFSCVGALSFLLWHIVEKKFLYRRSRYFVTPAYNPVD